jgi:hypothetical protein
MKYNSILLSILLLLISNQPVLSQSISDYLYLSSFLDDPQNQRIWVDNPALEKLRKDKTSIIPTPLIEPTLTTVNFDDVPFNGTAIAISPNRYSGVSFYAPYSNSNTFTIGNYGDSVSFPNSLIVGAIHPQGYVIPLSPLAIDFSQKMKDVSFYIAFATPNCNFVSVDVYDNGQFRQTVSVVWNPNEQWKLVQLNSISQKITNIRINAGCSIPSGYGIKIDNVTFQINPYSSPIGYLDSITTSISDNIITTPTTVGANGWSVDPDNTSASTLVDCYVDGVAVSNLIGRVTANSLSPDLPYPGNHRFSMPIPDRYRDGNQHQMYCYGLDVTGGDSPTLLTGSPKTFRFNAPVGSLDGIDADGYAYGWSQDPDLPTQSNQVHIYIDNTYVGMTNADLPFPTVTPGNHGYKYYIPDQYRNNQQHTLHAYGIDLTGDQNKLLTNSPKTFNLKPVVRGLVFEDTYSNQLSQNNVNDNPALSIGKRIFPDKTDPNPTIDNVNRRVVRVKANVVPAQANIEVFFKNFDLDDPSANTLPVDDDSGTNANAEDNRGNVGGSKAGQLTLPTGTTACTTVPPAGMFCSKTNAGGVATADFTVTMNPGDNFGIASSSNQTYLNGITMADINLQDTTGQTIPIGTNQNNAKAVRTEMLTVWRKIHLEIDSMGTVQGNFWTGQFTSKVKINKGKYQPIPLPTALPPNEDPENGIIEIQGKLLKIVYYERNLGQLLVENTQSSFTISASPQTPVSYKIYDDDDFDDDESQPGKTKNGDTGDDVRELPDKTLRLLQDLDGLDPQTGEPKNVFASVYIRPEYTWAANKTTPTGKPYNDTNVSFDANIEEIELNRVIYGDTNFITPRDSNSDEKDDFWVSYLLISYQGPSPKDLDPINELGQSWQGVAPSYFVADCLNSSVCPMVDPTDPDQTPYITTTRVPEGGEGALVFVETLRDYASKWVVEGKMDEKITAAHELAHTFGVKGDRAGILWKIMGYPRYNLVPPEIAPLSFHPEHIKILRSRVKSPGKY